MHTVGRHLLLKLYDCDAAALDSVDVVRDAVRKATEISSATIVGEIYIDSSPENV